MKRQMFVMKYIMIGLAVFMFLLGFFFIEEDEGAGFMESKKPEKK